METKKSEDIVIKIDDTLRKYEDYDRLPKILRDVKLEVLTNEPLLAFGMKNEVKMWEVYATTDRYVLMDYLAWQSEQWEDPNQLMSVEFRFFVPGDGAIKKTNDIIGRYPKTILKQQEPYQF